MYDWLYWKLCKSSLARPGLLEHLEWNFIISFRRHFWWELFRMSEIEFYFTKRLNAIVYFRKSSVLYVCWFLNVPLNFCFLNLIKFLLRAFPNLGNFEISICQYSMPIFFFFFKFHFHYFFLFSFFSFFIYLFIF